ncbi:GDSL-type esterase/lipase family protein [Roseateles sp.]|uniref:GDSL-type esterase/lipase family protein n=1 Tax=Roseateles sp. TaxID=1971397 RepID=UPI003265793F
MSYLGAEEFIIAVLMVGSFLYGVCIQKYKLFPLKQLVQVKKRLQGPAAVDSLVLPLHVSRRSLFELFPRQADVVMVGDSLTGYVEWDDLFPQLSIANRGINGDTTYGLRQRIPGILATKAKRAIICIGLNDFIAGRSVNDAFTDYTASVEALLEAGLQVHILSTVLSRSPAANSKILELNKRLLPYAASKGLTFTNLNALLAVDDMLSTDFTYDGTHLRAAAYVEWQKAIAALVTA